ncbi:MAG TPA: VC0807 family protein [Pseudonocardia sp.]|uniref:VC0807 family protein n=1 Tax=Pseudonocardia sp. TaxID=60912 RepID=UPI002B4B6AEF|nr:VC0807 family protein [Pseudonocardia sp.]HLU58844.1 VC0807 family protein [Pseudonocardia sp.]
MNAAATDEDFQDAVRFRPAAVVRGLGLDIGLPLATYYALHVAGVADWPALLAATGVAGLRIGWEVVRRRRLNPFATLMLVVFGVGLLLAVVSGDERVLLVQDSITLAGVALVFLVSSRWGTPLTLAAMQSFSPHKAGALTEAFRSNPEVRRGVRLSSAVWGGGLLSLAVVRVPLIYLLPVSVVVGLGTALTVVTFAGLIGWNVRYVARARRGG